MGCRAKYPAQLHVLGDEVEVVLVGNRSYSLATRRD